jgi:hypothetical protein
MRGDIVLQLDVSFGPRAGATYDIDGGQQFVAGQRTGE